MKKISRRQFIQYSVGGVTALWAGSKLPRWVKNNPAYAQAATQTLNFTITDTLKEMVTHNRINSALNYFWIFKEANLPADCPGPIIFTQEGESIAISVTNALDENHQLAIPGIGFTTGPIAPGDAFTGTLGVPPISAGTYLYFDTLNAPVNRVMGVHGAFIVMPNPPTGNPFNDADPAGPHPNVRQLFNDLGTQPWWPGLAWGEGAVNPIPFPPTPPFRQYIWLIHEASPLLFAAVGDNREITFTDITGRRITGLARDPEVFTNAFLNDLLVTQGANEPPIENFTPQYFTISGQSGALFSHGTPFITPHLRVGEPCILRCLNAGLWTHCLHIHANHTFVLKVRNELTGFSQFSAFLDLDPGQIPDTVDNPVWLDTFGSHPGDVWEWLLPYMRPPDVPNSRGIGRTDLSVPLPVNPEPVDFGIVIQTDGTLVDGETPPGVTTWPPIQEVSMAIPRVGTRAGVVPIHVQLSPLCYPMHDHSEPTQTAQGGNYNQGMIAGMNFIGDRNEGTNLVPAGVISFPNTPLTFDPAINPGFTADALQRAVFGADPDLSPQPPAGPLVPFEEEMIGTIGPSPVAGQEVITVTRARFVARKGKRVPTPMGNWSIQGTTTVPGSTLVFHVGPDFTGAVIGSVVANRRGKFKLTMKNSTVFPDETNTISVQSSNRTLLLNVPVTVE